jgi:muramoyltetrapeptide carboxypeptidase
MVAMDWARGLSGAACAHLSQLLAGETLSLEGTVTLRSGIAEGPLIGGCLSVVVAMIGTPWEPNFNGRILFLEDTGEKAYRVDRMLTQLRQTGALNRVAGIVFGAIHPHDGSKRERDLITDFIAEAVADLNCPVLTGIEAGHGTEHFTLPLGVNVRLDGANRRLVFTESAAMT